MAQGGDVQIEMFYDRLPFYPNALLMYQKGETTGSNKANRLLADGFWEGAKTMSPQAEDLLFDPQTSGGLLLSVPEAVADDLVTALHGAGVETSVRVARVIDGERPMVRVV
jgi:selenide,water dikinase